MFRRVAVSMAVLTAAAVLTSACTPTIAYEGFQAIEAKPADVRVGADTKSTVLTSLGSPLTVSTFDPNTWFYISQITEKVSFYRPHVRQRDIVAIAFDKESEKVTSVNTYSLKDGKIVAFNGRETPTRGREMTILEQLLGNIGRGGLLPQDYDPGNRPGQGRN